MLKNAIEKGSAFGRGDWSKVLGLAEDDEFTLIGYAHENLGNTSEAKKYYHLALNENEGDFHAIRQIAMIYLNEENHDLTYKYVKLGLKYGKYENNYFWKTTEFISNIVFKVLHPRSSLRKMHLESKETNNSTNNWLAWALAYKRWYERNQIN